MIPLYHDPHFTFRFEDDRLIPRFHLEGVGAGRRVNVYRIDPATGERLGLLTLRQLVLHPVRHLRHHLPFIAEKRAVLGIGGPSA